MVVALAKNDTFRDIETIIIQPPARVVLAFDLEDAKEIGLDPEEYLHAFNSHRSRFLHVPSWGPRRTYTKTTIERTFSAILAKSESELLDAILDTKERRDLEVIVNGLEMSDDQSRARLLRHLGALRRDRVIGADALIFDVAYNTRPRAIGEERRVGAAEVLLYSYTNTEKTGIKQLTPERMIDRVIDVLVKDRRRHYAAGIEVLIGIPELDGRPQADSLERKLAECLEEAGSKVDEAYDTSDWVKRAVDKLRNTGRPYDGILLSDVLYESHRPRKISHLTALKETMHLPSVKAFVMSGKDNPDTVSIAKDATEYEPSINPVFILERPFVPEIARNAFYYILGVHRTPEPMLTHSINIVKFGGSELDRMKANPRYIDKVIDFVASEARELQMEGMKQAKMYDAGFSKKPGWSIVFCVGGGPRREITERMKYHTIEDLVDAQRANAHTLNMLFGGLRGRYIQPEEVYSLTEEQLLESICIIPELPIRVARDFIPDYNRIYSDDMTNLLAQILNPENNPNRARGARVRVIYMKDLPMDGRHGEDLRGRICNFDPNDKAERGNLVAYDALSAQEVIDDVISRDRKSPRSSQHLIEDSALAHMNGWINISRDGKVSRGKMKFRAVHFIGSYPDQLRTIVTGGINEDNHPGSIIYMSRSAAMRDKELRPYLVAQETPR